MMQLLRHFKEKKTKNWNVSWRKEPKEEPEHHYSIRRDAEQAFVKYILISKLFVSHQEDK